MPSLAERRHQAGIGLRAAARAADISPQSLQRYETGDRRIPHATARKLEAVYSRPAPQERVLAAVGSGGKALATIRRILDPTERRVLNEMIDDGRLALHPVASTDALGRQCTREGVFLGTRSAGLTRSSPPVSGPELQQARRRCGIPATEMAGRVGVAPARYRDWEATQPPLGRLPQLATIFADRCPSGPELRQLRSDAGWSLKKASGRVGVGLSVFHDWETTRRAVPPGRRIKLLAACSEMDRDRGAPLHECCDAMVAYVREHPGVLRSEIRHLHRRKRAGKTGSDPLAEEALDSLLAGGRLVAPMVFSPDRRGGAKFAVRLFLPEDAPPAGDLGGEADNLTGHDVARRRLALSLTQREFGDLIGCRVSFVGKLERYGDDGIPPHWARQILSRLRREHAGGLKLQQIKDAVVEIVRSTPGIAKFRLMDQVGHGHVARRAVKELESSGTIVLAQAWDPCNRAYQGLYLKGDAALSAHVALMSGSDLAMLMADWGLRPAELAHLLGCGAGAVNGWLSGRSSISAPRARQIRSLGPSALKRVPPRRDVHRERIIRAVGEGVRPSRLIALRKTEAGERAFHAALAEGDLHVETRVELTRDGRPYRRRWIMPGPDASREQQTSSPMSGTELRALRVRSSLTQVAFAARLGVRNGRVSGWETGRVPIPAGRAALIRMAFPAEA